MTLKSLYNHPNNIIVSKQEYMFFKNSLRWEETVNCSCVTHLMIFVINMSPFYSQEAEALGKKDEERLLQTRKLSLVVDLDQTLIHTTMELVPEDMEVLITFMLRL